MVELVQFLKEPKKFIEMGAKIPRGVLLCGNPGTGKTALSLALGMKACLENRSVLFISVPELLIEIKEAMSNSQYVRYKRKFEKIRNNI